MSTNKHMDSAKRMAAIAWAADRAGVSYGRIVSTCRPAELDQIYMDSKEYLRKKAEKLREIEKVDIMGPVNEYLDDVNERDHEGRLPLQNRSRKCP